MAIGDTVVPIGKVFLIGFGLAIVAGHFYMKNKQRQAARNT
jgi:hypothetical protein